MIQRARSRFSIVCLSLCGMVGVPLSACGNAAEPHASDQADTTAVLQDAGNKAGTKSMNVDVDAGSRPTMPFAPADAGSVMPAAATPATMGAAVLAMDGGVVPPPDTKGPAQTSFPALQPMQVGAPALLAKNFTLAESPTWDPCGQRLLVSDPTQNKISEIGADGQVTVLLTDTDYTNGMVYDRDGSLLMAQMGNNMGGRVARLDRSGKLAVLVDKNPSGGRFHTVDDLAVRSDGTIYFSDGDFSHANHTTLVLTPTPLYILKPGPDPRMLVAGPSVAGPNGVELSRDQNTLYLDAYFSDAVMKYQVAADGTLSAGTMLAGSMTNADSLCLDLAGNLYVGVAGGLQILRPDGTRLKTIPVEFTNKVTNCTFGGPHGTTLFITAWTEVWKVDDMPIPGLDWSINQRIDCGAVLPTSDPNAPPSFAPLPPRRP